MLFEPHLSLKDLILVADSLKENYFETINTPIKQHLEICQKCRKEVIGIIDLSDNVEIELKIRKLTKEHGF